MLGRNSLPEGSDALEDEEEKSDREVYRKSDLLSSEESVI